MLQNGTSPGLEIRTSGSDVVLKNNSCVFYNNLTLSFVDVDPGLGSPGLAELVQSIRSIGVSDVSDGWVTYGTRSTCIGAGQFTVTSRVFETAEPVDASNPFSWPAMTGHSLNASRTANGWIAWSGLLGPAPSEQKLLLADLETNRGATMYEIATGVQIRELELSAAGMLWLDPSDETIRLLLAPFASTSPVVVASTTAFDSLGLEGRYAYWVDDGEIFVLDLDRPAPGANNPRSVGLGEQPTLAGNRLVWTNAGEVYAIEIDDPFSVPDRISEPGFHHFDVVASGDWSAWKRCDAAGGPGAGCADPDPSQTVQVFDLTQPYAPDFNPSSPRDGISGSFLLALGAVGFAWSEPGALTAVYYYDPLAPEVVGANPIEVDATDPFVSILVSMDEGIIWLGGPWPSNGDVLFVSRAALFAATNP